MRNFVIGQLTQSSTWFGLIIILSAIFLPHSWIFGVGVVIMITDDARLQKFFSGMRKEVESWWEP